MAVSGVEGEKCILLILILNNLSTLEENRNILSAAAVSNLEWMVNEFMVYHEFKMFSACWHGLLPSYCGLEHCAAKQSKTSIGERNVRCSHPTCCPVGSGETPTLDSIDSYMKKLHSIIVSNPHEHESLINTVRDVVNRLDR